MTKTQLSCFSALRLQRGAHPDGYHSLQCLGECGTRQKWINWSTEKRQSHKNSETFRARMHNNLSSSENAARTDDGGNGRRDLRDYPWTENRISRSERCNKWPSGWSGRHIPHGRISWLEG